MKKMVVASITALTLSSALMAAVPASCNGCHGADGSKNTMVQGGGVPNTLAKADVKAALEGYKAGTLNKFGKGAMMVSFAKALTPEQIDEIANAWGK